MTGATVAFNAVFTVGNIATNHTYLFTQTSDAISTTSGQLIDLMGLTTSLPLTALSLTSSTTAKTAYVTPIAIDLNGNGVNYLSRDAGVAYDYNQDGTAELTAWVAGTDGMLAIQSSDGTLSVVFSTQAGETDLQGLARVYDVNQDGIFDKQDGSFTSFGVWQDANSDGLVEAGEFTSLTDRGIASIGLASDGHSYVTSEGDVQVSGASAYTKTDGTFGLIEDAAFAVTHQYTSIGIQAEATVVDSSPDNDTLVGSIGVDVFKWSLNDQGTAGVPATDLVINFNTADKDVLDLRDLLTGEHDGSITGMPENLSSYLHFDKSSSGTDTIVSISTAGQFDATFDSSKVDQAITIASVDLVGVYSQQQIIDNLLNNQNLRVDH